MTAAARSMAPAMVDALGASNPFATAMRASAQGRERMADAAQRLATDVEPEAVVDLALGKVQVRAAAAIVRTVDEMTGTLIDTLA